eukprot:Phypoly_transcript_04195.p1 GENE.Phypoly_transcript_04195~~Phypoly_transcript_04195.p1  ORF type:complete len:505 (+),score=51.71 Phypoly_transcript_04195:76-1590(+)
MVRTTEPELPKGASVGAYEIIIQCGAGTYGSVYRAIHKTSRRVVALKKVAKFPLEDGFPVECKYLEKLCSSRNVVNMIEYFYTLEGQLVLIFEYMEMDLWKLISGPSSNVPMLQMKCIMKQLFEGLNQCHTAGIMHRDVKPSNLLINASGVLKLADFGLTTSFVKPPYLSNNVVSLYYRPPELLMGSHNYGPEIDIWSAGCILVELLTNDYLFAGSNESDQLDMIFKVFGTPDESIWPGISSLPGWGLVESGRQHPLRDLGDNYSYIDSNALDLATRLLQLDPKKRISCAEALNHPWFSDYPLPCTPSLIPNLWKDKKFETKFRSTATSNYNANKNQNNNTNNTTNSFANTTNIMNGTYNSSTNNYTSTNDYNMMTDNNYNYVNYNCNMAYYNTMNNYYNNYNFYNNFYGNNLQNNPELYNYYMNMNVAVNPPNFNEQYYFNYSNNMFYNANNFNNDNYNNFNNFNNFNNYEYDNYNYNKSFDGRPQRNDKVISQQRKGKVNEF